MKLGVAIEDTWDFFHEIYADFQANHDVSLYQRRKTKSPIFYDRINQHYFKQDIAALMAANDLVFFEWASHLLAAASHMPKTCKIVTRLHRFELNEWADKVNWENVDLLIVVCQTKKDEVLARFPQLEGKVEVVYGAVDTQKFAPINKPYGGDIGILCHMTPRKRVYELILTLYDTLKLNANLKLHVAGGMHVAHRDYYESLVYLVDQLGMQDCVKFYGHVDSPKKWFENVDVLISNGYSEGLQVSPMEAMSCGRYVLSHFWSGADEMLPEEYLYFTNGELGEMLLSYHQTSADYKQEQSEFMRNRVLKNFDIWKNRLEIRQLIEEIHAGTYTPRPKKVL
ncbi:MAG: glycosyltransferase family 4 protein [Chloroflexota bacterium]